MTKTYVREEATGSRWYCIVNSNGSSEWFQIDGFGMKRKSQFETKPVNVEVLKRMGYREESHIKAMATTVKRGFEGFQKIR